MSARGAVVLVVACAHIALAAPACAQNAGRDVRADTAEPALAEAQALFRRGIELGEQDHWADALEHFRRSWELAERPNTMFNIAYASHRLGRFREAIAALDEYLARTEGELSERREEAVQLRGEALASLVELRVLIEPPEARLLVDGELDPGIGPVRRIVLDPGRHVLRASAPGRDEASVTISVLAGERGERQIVLAPSAPQDPLPRPPPPGRSVLEEPLFWIVTAAIAVGAGVGIGVGVAVGTSGPSYGGSTGVVIEALRF